MVRLKDIAERSGVSLKTVSNVVNDYEHVSEKMRRRVNQAIAEMGYVPDEAARRLAKGRDEATGTPCPPLRLRIGVLTHPDLNKYDDPFHCRVLSGIEAALLARKNILAFSRTYLDFLNDPLSFNYLMEHEKLDGIITFVWHDEVRDFFKPRLGKHFPIVSVNSVPFCDSLRIDMKAAISRQFDYLQKLGHQKIGFIGVSDLWYNELDPRYLAYLDEIKTRQLPFRPEWLPPGGVFTQNDSGYHLAKALLKSAERPTALICATDNFAIGAIKACHEAKLQLPKDMSIIGFDNIPLSSLVYPALTTTGVDQVEFGRVAVQMLTERIHNPNLPIRSHEIQTDFIIRESTAAR